jgi:acetolactate synthase-1/2/3 large subunit
MPNMSGGQAIVRSLLEHGVSTVFGIPGIQLDHLYDAFYERRNNLHVVHARHEQGAAFMAMGYAQASGETGVFAVVPGPGLLNSLTALATAASANLPVLGLTGQIPSYQIGQNYGMAHELKDQRAVSRGIVDWVARAEHPSQVPALLADAFAAMHSGRKSPAVFEMAPDQLGARAPVEPLPPVPPQPAPEPDAELVGEAAERLSKAARPLILVGGGIVDAEAPLLAVAEQLGAPVVMSPNARGTISDAHPLAFEMLGGQELWQAADVALVVGTRFTTTALAWGREDEVETIRIDIDPTQIVKPRRAGIEIVTSAARGLEALAGALTALGPRKEPPSAALAAVRDELAAKLADLEPLSGYGRALRAALPADGMVFADVTRFSVFTRFAVPFYEPRSFFMPGYQATLGWAYPAALGAKIARPERKVVAITGDGGFMFTVQELATAQHHRIPVTVLVFDNKAYGNVKMIQAQSYGGRHIAVDLTNPDFVAMAASFGMMADRVEAPEQLEEVLRRHLAAEVPSLIEVQMPEAPNVWSLVRRPPSQGEIRG